MTGWCKETRCFVTLYSLSFNQSFSLSSLHTLQRRHRKHHFRKQQGKQAGRGRNNCPRSPGSGGQQGLGLKSHRTLYIYTEGLASSQPEKGADWDAPLWGTDRSQHALNYWEPLQIKSAACRLGRRERHARAREGLRVRFISYRAAPSGRESGLLHPRRGHQHGQAKWRHKGPCSRQQNKVKPQGK